MVDAINDQNFDEETSNGVALVDFWATWCGNAANADGMSKPIPYG